MTPEYDLEKIRLSTDPKTWERAMEIYEKGKVIEFEESHAGFTARVLGSETYDSAVSEDDCCQGDCNCFIGRQGSVCKHIVALAIYAVERGGSLSKKNKIKNRRKTV